MTERINISNYEAYYLDYLEGNLSADLIQEFEQFLRERPEYMLEDESIPTLLEEDIQLNELEKSLLLKMIVEVTDENVSMFLIAEIEGQLSAEEQTALNAYCLLHPEVAIEKQWYQKAILPQEQILYTEKGKLKKETRILPIYWASGAAAASILLLFSIYNGGSVNESSNSTGKSIAQRDKSVHQHTNHQSLIDDSITLKEEQRYSTTIQKKNAPVEAEQVMENIAQLSKRELNWINSDKQVLLPNQKASSSPTVAPENNTKNIEPNDLALLGMSNPIKPITNSISEKLNTVIDFRTAKPTNEQKGGFYLKIGKFEIIRKRTK